MKKYNIYFKMLIACLIFGILSGCAPAESTVNPLPDITLVEPAPTDFSPDYESESGGSDVIPSIDTFSADTPWVEINGNQPFFVTEEITTEAFEEYSDLDDLGRCGVAFANVCQEIMPTEARGSIGSVTPSGWQSVKYDIVDGKYLYNRCHLIGFQLAGENANKRNLITGTRYLNIDGMLPFENLVADYVKETEHHVLYRVTPIFEGDNLVADGVLMEGYSVEDNGEGVCYNVFCFNAQPGISIDYATGESWLTETAETSNIVEESAYYILNTNSKKFHLPECSLAAQISEKNRQEYTGSREYLIEQGYNSCATCHS